MNGANVQSGRAPCRGERAADGREQARSYNDFSIVGGSLLPTQGAD